MFEVEMKFRVQSVKDFMKILEQKYFARFDPEVIETDHFFQHPVRDFAKTDECLRLRRRQNELMITYKGAKIDTLTKMREEIELPLYSERDSENDSEIDSEGNSENADRIYSSISSQNHEESEIGGQSGFPISKDAEIEKRTGEWTKLLNRLGFYEKAVVSKHRRYGTLVYESRPITVTLDYLDKVGDFTEFELSAETEEEIESVRSVLLRLAASLGLGQSIRISYLELCLAADH